MSKDDFTLPAITGPGIKHSQMNANFNRVTYWSGVWSGGATYSQYEEVYHEGALWICKAGVTASVDEPALGSVSWDLKTPSSGRGGMTIDAPIASLGTITGTFQDIDNYDSIDLNTLGVTLTPATGTFSFQWPGIWQLGLTLIFEHDDVNSGRDTFIRMWNVTDSVAVGTGLPWFIGRNQPGSNIILPFPMTISEADIGKVLVAQIGGGDDITVTMVHAQSIDAYQFGPALP